MIIALLALVISVTPAASAATQAIKHALFADNAGKVGGIKASRRPTANQLLALDKQAKLPASVFPLNTMGLAGAKGTTGPAGATGAKGDTGPAGLNGASVVARIRGGPITVPPGSTILTPFPESSWTQGATETDLFLGSATITHPTGCAFGQGLSLEINASGTPVAFVGPLTPPTNSIFGWLLDPGASTARTLILSASNTCEKGGSVDALSVNVVKAL